MKYITPFLDIKKINYFLIFLIIALPWFYFSEAISYDLFLYKEYSKSFSEAFWDNKLSLYFFSKILFFVNIYYRIKIIHFLCVFPLLLILSKKCEPKYFLSIILFLFFSLFSGQFRMSLSLFFVILSLQQKKYTKYISIILAILSHYAVVLYFIYLFVKQSSNKVLKIFIVIIFQTMLLVNWYYNTEIFKKIQFYFSNTGDYSILFVIPLLILMLEYKYLKDDFFEFLFVAVFTVFVYQFYDLSSRVSELLIFSILFYVGRKFVKINNQTLLVALLVFLYRFINIFFFSGQFRILLINYLF